MWRHAGPSPGRDQEQGAPRSPGANDPERSTFAGSASLSADPPLGPQDQRTLVYDTAAPMLITAGDNAKPNQVRGFARQDVC